MTVRFDLRFIKVLVCISIGWASLFATNIAAASEAEMLEGVVIAGGITCPILKTDTGETVSLMGVTAQNAPVGQHFSATGNFVRYSNCQQAVRTFRVDAVLNPD